ncbi:MAG: AAA family ATPase [Ilumatobacter sp.]|nr:AAA family ATPase [Ilumatobacter sp.]
MSAPTELLERDDALTRLHQALARVRDGAGEVAVVTAEAGGGKTSVIHEFMRRSAGRPTILRGACDPLSAPRPLGPLIDAVGEVDRDLALRLAGGVTRAEAFATAVGLLDGVRSEGRPTVFVVEDVHWADDATLDLITFLGRRIASLPALLVLSYRDDEVDARHPLRATIGELTSAIGCRVHLAPLSRDAVAELALGTPFDPDELWRITAGNAFFVTEALGAGGDELPSSIRDAVLARASRLPEDARAVLDVSAIVPGRIERWLLDVVADDVDAAAGVEICTRRGLLNLDRSGTIGFRHELARLAIDEALPAARRRAYHARALDALRDPPYGRPDDARLAHHAAGADDAHAILHHAPLAAAEASAIGGHREAARHLEAALRYAHLVDDGARGELITRYGNELTMLARVDDALDAFVRASEIFLRIGDLEQAADALTRTGRPLTSIGRQPEAEQRIAEAAELLVGRPPSSAAALVTTNIAANHMLARRFDECETEARRAIAMAEEVGDEDVLAEACIQTGIALAMSDDDAGLARIERGIEVARRVGNDHMVALGYSQIGSGYGEIRRYDIAVPALREGLAFAEASEIVGSMNYIGAWLARCELEVGDWDHAAERASTLLRSPRFQGISRFVALVTLAWLRGRRGDPGAEPLLDEALELARTTEHVQRMWPVAACRAEIAWLHGRIDDELELVDEAMALARRVDWSPAVEELAHWRHVADGRIRHDSELARTPFGLSAAGRFELAAERWAEIGCPYEEAMARYAVRSPEELHRAFEIFDRLGATPMRRRVAEAMRDTGVSVPRGPTSSTLSNPGGLTKRELDVLVLVATGRTNREIGDELGISAKTVGHHVSHILGKLGVRTRAEAAVEAERLGLGDR